MYCKYFLLERKFVDMKVPLMIAIYHLKSSCVRVKKGDEFLAIYNPVHNFLEREILAPGVWSRY